ncbi:MAG: TonB-dependent receptor, partial [Acidobacteriota bacterium]|nr:TonB-dependent receptor [Acidobacteriota bacterium]
MYSNTKQDNGLAPAPFTISSSGNGRDEARASLFNPFGNQLGSVRYRLVQELNNRRTFFDHDYWRYVGAIKGDFNFKDNGFISHLGYDVGILYEKFDERRTDSGDATRANIRRLIAANIFNPFIGQNAPPVGTAPEYVNGVATGRMIPYNNLVAGVLFSNTAPATHVVVAGGPAVTDDNAGAAYIGNSLFRERDWLVDPKINVHLFPNMYNGGVDLAVGYEHREIAQHSIPDNIQSANDQLGFNQSPNTETLQVVNSVFTELTFPIITSTMNIPFVRSLEIAGAFRYEKFDDKDQYTHATGSFSNENPSENFGGTPRISLRYQPIADLTLRANWNQSFRSPLPANLFDPRVQDFPQLVDPFNPGGTVTLQPPEGVFRQGNTGLKPETTDAYSAGLVYTPKWLSGFTMTVDYYQLYTTNLILSGDDFAQVLLTNNTPDPDGFSGDIPGRIGLGVTRDANGFLRGIDSATQNAGKRFVQGIDVTAVYELPTQNFGTFTLSGGWNHFFSWKAGLAGAGLHNFLGDYNNSTLPLAPGGIPFNKGFLRFEWQGPAGWLKGFDFVATGNYIGDYEDDPNFIFGNFIVGGEFTANQSFAYHHRVDSYETLDMQLSYEFIKPEMPAAGYSKDAKDAKSMGKEVAGVENSSIWQRMLWDTKVTIGVNNAFDRYPPTVLGAFNDNYDTSNYVIRNRYWYVSLKKKF